MYDRPPVMGACTAGPSDDMRNALAGGLSGTLKPPVPRNGSGEVAQRLAEQEKTAAMLHELISELASHIDPILAPDTDSNNSIGAQLPPAMSQVASCIAQNTQRIQEAIYRLRSLNDRVTV